MIASTPVMPQKAGERYHIITIDWFNKWKCYTGYEKLVTKSIPNWDVDDSQSTATGGVADVNMLSDDVEKLHIIHTNSAEV